MDEPEPLPYPDIPWRPWEPDDEDEEKLEGR